MIQEKMTIRKALGQKKLLDAQIEELSRSNYLAVTTSADAVIDGLKATAWVGDSIQRFQSLNDKLKRREAIATAIMAANATHTVAVKKFIGIDKQSDELENISFAAAIARKHYLQNLLDDVVYTIQSQVTKASVSYQSAERHADEKVTERVQQEFSNVTQSSSKVRKEREDELRQQYKVELLDPNDVAKKIMGFKNYIEEYLLEIDAILGHATEVTEVTVEY